MPNVLFSNTTSGNPDSYLWTFGDGGSSTQANPTYTYASTGIFVVRLTATKSGVGSTVAKALPILAGTVITATLLVNNEDAQLSTNAGSILAAVN